MRLFMLTVITTAAVLWTGVDPAGVRGQDQTLDQTQAPAEAAPDANSAAGSERAVSPSTTEVAEGAGAPAETPADLSPGNGSIAAGIVLASVGVTGLLVSGLVYYWVGNFCVAVSSSGCSVVNPDYTAPVVGLVISAGVTLTGFVLVVAGLHRNEVARDRAAEGTVLLPFLVPAAEGEGLLLGAAGTF